MLQDNANRIKNILSGNIQGSTKIIAGYTKLREKHVEGDVWEENDKLWTIKHGIKQTINKLDIVRKLMKMPYVCPKCKQKLSTKLDEKFWNLRGQCFDCSIKEDNERIIDGSYKQYMSTIIYNNKKTWLNDVKQEAEEYLRNINNHTFVTEQGDIEQWVGGQSTEELKKIIYSQIEEVEKILDEEYNKLSEEQKCQL